MNQKKKQLKNIFYREKNIYIFLLLLSLIIISITISIERAKYIIFIYLYYIYIMALKKTRNLSGGEVIGAGGFGCAYLNQHCAVKKSKKRTTGISKLSS